MIARQVLTTLLLLSSVAVARAEVWAYVDPSGTAHFARHKVDDRYQLYFKGRSSLDPSPPPAPDDDPEIDAIRNSWLYARVSESRNPARFQALIDQHATAHGLSPALVKAVITVESAFDPEGVSPKGAIGLMQVLPETGERYGLAPDARRTLEQKLRDPATNVRVGTRYLRDLLALFDNDLALALAAYNAGEGAVARYDNRVPPFPETQEYVRLVQAFYRLYQPPPPSPATRAGARVTLEIGRGATSQPPSRVSAATANAASASK